MAEFNYIILKINGIDVSQIPQNEAVKMFLTANEPIVLAVRRKCDVYVHKNLTNNSIDVGSGIQESFNSQLEELKISASASKQATTKYNATNRDTTITAAEMKTSEETYPLENELMFKLTPTTASVDINDKTESSISSIQKSLSKSTQTDDSIFFSLQHQNAKDTADRLIEQEHHLFEQCLAPEIDIEEITLRKSDSNERLGLTVCYSGGCSNNGSGNNNGALSGSDDNETCTEVYISDIHPDSIAGRDGRLRQGDQILQINGKDIKNKEETESLMAENNNAVTLLVSRYLCADEDDFNDPSVADVDVEDDDDEDDEEYYDDNNLAYENCFMANDYINVVDELDKVLLSQVAAQHQDSVHATEKSSIFNTSLTVLNTANSVPSLTAVTAVTTSLAKSKCTASAATNIENNIKNNATRDVEQNSIYSPNGELNVKPAYTKKNDIHATSTQAVLSVSTTSTNHGDYETEHIYETIPEDSESEPFYCSPYESTFYMTAVGSCSSAATDVLQLQQQKQRVAQWLGLKSHAVAATTTSMTMATTAPRQSMRSSSGCGRSLTHYDASNFIVHNRNGTLHSAITTATNGSSNCGGGCISGVVGSTNTNTDILQNDEKDNSSSAYNTGASNKSVAPLILVLNQNNRGDTLTCCLDNEQMMAAASPAIKNQRLLLPKYNIASPKHSGFSLSRNGNGGQPNRGNSDLQATETFVQTTTTPLDVSQQQLFSPKTMYTNEANLYQTMLLQQHLFRKAITRQQHQHHLQQEQQQVHCPQFTAPNLSQYHFVSSQEVSAAHVNTTASASTTASTTVVVAHTNANEETAMVWKVKRRPDGTRYIVRRPARNRLLRDRSVRLNTERVRNNEMTTTEEDTVSEVKTGRYWSKEERKKHIERARERRQQHQHNASGSRTFMSTTTMRISDRTALKLQQQQQRERSLQREQKQQHQYLQQQQQIMSQQQQSNTRLHRQSSLKPSQHHQLQFNSVTTQQQQSQFCVSTISVSCASPNIPTDIKSKQLSLPCKNVSSFTHTICSPVDVLPSGPITVASAGGGAVIANSMSSGVADAVPVIATQNFQTINDSSKIKDLLSVTTV